MRSPEIVAGLGMLLSIALGLFIATRMNRKRIKLAPRHRRRFDRKHTMWSAVMIAGFAAVMFYQGQMFAACLLAIVLMFSLFGVFNQPMRHDDVEARANYAHDSSRCGRCDYDLMGNESGICPECGWQVPASPEFVEPPHWTYWWKSWEIQHVEQWPKPLVWCLFSTAMVVSVLVWALMTPRQSWGLAVVIAAALINNAILVIRLVAYARRQRME